MIKRCHNCDLWFCEYHKSNIVMCHDCRLKTIDLLVYLEEASTVQSHKDFYKFKKAELTKKINIR